MKPKRCDDCIYARFIRIDREPVWDGEKQVEREKLIGMCMKSGGTFQFGQEAFHDCNGWTIHEELEKKQQEKAEPPAEESKAERFKYRLILGMLIGLIVLQLTVGILKLIFNC